MAADESPRFFSILSFGSRRLLLMPSVSVLGLSVLQMGLFSLSWMFFFYSQCGRHCRRRAVSSQAIGLEEERGRERLFAFAASWILCLIKKAVWRPSVSWCHPAQIQPTVEARPVANGVGCSVMLPDLTWSIMTPKLFFLFLSIHGVSLVLLPIFALKRTM